MTFNKNRAPFPCVRCGCRVVPEDCVMEGEDLASMYFRGECKNPNCTQGSCRFYLIDIRIATALARILKLPIPESRRISP